MFIFHIPRDVLGLFSEKLDYGAVALVSNHASNGGIHNMVILLLINLISLYTAFNATIGGEKKNIDQVSNC